MDEHHFSYITLHRIEKKKKTLPTLHHGYSSLTPPIHLPIPMDEKV
jgi:hypothetical protein